MAKKDIGVIEGKKGTSQAFSDNTVSDALKSLVEALGYSLLTMTPADKSALAVKLSAVEGISPPWTWRYVHNVLRGKIDASEKFGRAVHKLLAVFDGADPLMVQMVKVQVFARNVKPGAVILAASRKCANPNCPIEFVPVVPRQRFHSPECREAARHSKSRGKS